jgi:hypothetical protein
LKVPEICNWKRKQYYLGAIGVEEQMVVAEDETVKSELKFLMDSVDV